MNIAATPHTAEDADPQAIDPDRASLDLGVIGNSAIAALIDRRGSIVWSCLPRFDGDPFFCNLLNHSDGGDWSVELEGFERSEQRYLRNTAILETVLYDDEGNALRIIDFAPRFKQQGRLFRPQNIIRIVEPMIGAPRARIRMRPRQDYGASEPERSRGTSHIKFHLPEGTVRMTTDLPLIFIENETPLIFDRAYAMILGPDESLEEAPMHLARRFQDRTHNYWIDWTRYLSLPADWQDVTIRAAITLKLCASEDTGAVLAALTTSIPEYGATGRTWDYRFCWLRDSYFTVKALNRLGATKTMEDYLRYVVNIAAASPDGYLQPLFGIGMEQNPDEEIVTDLPGYRGLGPVRRGNAAYTQVQNDGYGSVILAITQYFFDERLPQQGDVPLFERLEPLGEQAYARWDKPDAGLWEFRTREEVHTHSSIMCWAACDRLARIATKLELTKRAHYWRDKAEIIRDGTLERGWSDKLKAYVSAFGGENLDASLLLMPELGFIDAQDPRYLSTLDAIEKHLRFGNHVFRYRAPDDFGEPETAFTACTFWLIDALARVGRLDDARAVFEDVLKHRNHLGLLSEGLHIESGELWGNFPQTYSMVGLINSITHLSRKWDEVL